MNAFLDIMGELLDVGKNLGFVIYIVIYLLRSEDEKWYFSKYLVMEGEWWRPITAMCTEPRSGSFPWISYIIWFALIRDSDEFFLTYFVAAAAVTASAFIFPTEWLMSRLYIFFSVVQRGDVLSKLSESIITMANSLRVDSFLPTLFILTCGLVYKFIHMRCKKLQNVGIWIDITVKNLFYR